MGGEGATKQGDTMEADDCDGAYDDMIALYIQINEQLADQQERIDSMEASGQSEDTVKKSDLYKKRDDLKNELKRLENDWVNGTTWPIEELKKPWKQHSEAKRAKK